MEQEANDLRCAAARERIEELMRVSGLAVIDRSALSATTETALEQLRKSSGLNDDAWESCLNSFGQPAAEHSGGCAAASGLAAPAHPGTA